MKIKTKHTKYVIQNLYFDILFFTTIIIICRDLLSKHFYLKTKQNTSEQKKKEKNKNMT